MVSRLSRTAPLLSALLSCAAALRLRSTSVASSLSRHVKPPPLPQVQTGANTPTNRLPPPPHTHPNLLRVVSLSVGQERGGKSEESTPPQPLAGKFGRLLSVRSAHFFQGPGGKRGKQTAALQSHVFPMPWDVRIDMLKQLKQLL